MAERQATGTPDAARLGMLVFLASEAMLFGGIFAAALSLRIRHPADYVAAADRLNLWLGTANTAVLLTSSLLAALAVEAVRAGAARRARWAFAAAAAVGLAFLAIKAVEYGGDWHEGVVPGAASGLPPARQMFFNLYFLGTGLHALHAAAGIALLATATRWRGALEDRRAMAAGNIALYWHLVDAIWVFLYPTLYLAGVS